MTVVPARPSRRKMPTLLQALKSSPPSRAERLYLALAALLCVGLLACYGVGRSLEGAEQQQNRAIVAQGRDTPPGILPPAGSAHAASASQAGQDARPATAPAWVQAFRGTRLWSASAGGTAVSSLSQWQFLRVTGADQQRFNVETQPSDGPVAGGWVDIDDVGISGPPPDWVVCARDLTLFAAAEGADSVANVPTGTTMVVSGEGTTDRLFVYWPVDPTSRRTGYGWVPRDGVSPAAAPPGVALPSPQFRTVTKGRPGTYRVNVGDSVATIVARFGVTRDELYRLNGLEATAQLLIGQVLQVPAPGDRAQSQSPGPRKVREISPGWVGSEHAVVIDADSGEILWARDPNTPIAPASLTKIVTALVTLEHANLSDTVTTRVDSRRMTDSTVMGLYPGEEVTVEDLLYGLMLPSGNDAALALAQYVAGTREAFADLMNEKARSLGLTGSHFVNPHGLDTDGHVSTPYDMAMLARAGMRDPTFRALAAAKMYETPRGKGYTLYNLNRLLMQYPGADGVKIGFTDAAGRAIVGSATRDGHRVIVAMMRSPDIYADSATLLDWAFSSYSWDPD